MKKTGHLLLAILLSVSLNACASGNPPVGTASPADSAAGTAETSAAETSEAVAASENAEASATSETSAPAETEAPAEVTEDGKLNHDLYVLYTSDVHCGIDQGLGYAGLEGIKESLQHDGNHVLLVDDGDAIQGEPIGTMTKGDSIIDLMNDLEYDVAIPGNHEFDYGVDQFLALTKKANFPYLSCNFAKDDKLIFDPYLIKEIDGIKIGFVGCTTPESLTKSTPTYFQDEKGNYIYSFKQDSTGEKLYQAVQNAVDDCRKDGADYVFLLAHLGNDETSKPWTYADVVSHTSGIDVVLDGHSHDTDQVTMLNKDGKNVIRSACGTKMANVGWVKLSADNQEFSNGLISYQSKIGSAPKLLSFHNKLSDAVDKANASLDSTLNEVVAHSDVALTIEDPTETDKEGNPIRLIRRQETNLGDFCADAYRDQSGADIAFVNGGGIRANIPAGDITLGQILSVHPWGNSLMVVEVSGQQVLDALEWASRGVPDECGGFLQVSGLTYEIDSSIDSTVTMDENKMFTGVGKHRRVKNVLVDGKPIDPKKTYTLASHNYMLLDAGDGFSLFKGCKVVQEPGKLDNQVLIDYIRDTLKGTVGKEYSNPYGEGRIVVK